MPDAAERTQAEIDATVAKLLAEAEKAQAEARQAIAQARKDEANAEEYALDLEDRRYSHERSLLSDYRQHVYRLVGEISSKSVHDCMTKLTEWSRMDPGCDIEIIFSSPGGSVIDGMALFDFLQMLRQSGHHITTGTVGMAASMAGILLQAGDTRWVGEQAWVLIHRASFGAIGQTFDIEDRVEWIKRVEKRIIGIFVSRSGGKLTSRKIKRNWERKDWWLDAEEAIELGVADEVRGTLQERGE